MKCFTTLPFLQITNKSVPTTGSSSHLFTQTYWLFYEGALKRHVGSVVKHTVGMDFYCLMTSCTNFLFQERKNAWSMKKKSLILTLFSCGIRYLSVSVAVGLKLCTVMLLKINNSINQNNNNNNNNWLINNSYFVNPLQETSASYIWKCCHEYPASVSLLSLC